MVIYIESQSQVDSKNFILVLFESRCAKTFSIIRNEQEKIINSTKIRVKDGTKWHNGQIMYREKKVTRKKNVKFFFEKKNQNSNFEFL